MLADFLSFLVSLLLSLNFYPLASRLLENGFNLGSSLAKALGFLILAVLFEAILGLTLGLLISKFAGKYSKNLSSKILAIPPSMGEGVIIISFVLTLLLAVPISTEIKSDIETSKISNVLIKNTQGIENKLNDVFGGVVENSLIYLVVEPESKQKIALSTGIDGLTVDNQAEQQMFDLVNQERLKSGAGELAWDENLAKVARDYAEDMWERKYFSHYSPDGEDVSDRLQKANISYFIVGENLALAPTVSTAMIGLLNSEKHRRNMLDVNFEKVGIGVMDNGIYGKIFIQIFVK
jgi:uncharacterized protein YkwD